MAKYGSGPGERDPKTGRLISRRLANTGMVSASFTADEMVKLTNRVRGELKASEKATVLAHVLLAQQLQYEMYKVLNDKVIARGRAQRDKARGSRLSDALVSQETRKVDKKGWTVGYLDQNPAVRPYYRNLEEGTRVHVGRFLSGVFRDATGRPAGQPFPDRKGYSGPRAGSPFRQRKGPKRGGSRGQRIIHMGAETDATFIQTKPYRREKAYWPGVRIKRPIIGYQYIQGGTDNFRRKQDRLMEQAYVSAFSHYKLDLLARALNRDQALKTRVTVKVDLSDARKTNVGGPGGFDRRS